MNELALDCYETGRRPQISLWKVKRLIQEWTGGPSSTSRLAK